MASNRFIVACRALLREPNKTNTRVCVISTMKTRLLVATTAILLSLQGSITGADLSRSDEYVRLLGGTLRRVAVGMTRAEVHIAAGAPDAVLDEDVCVYWNFRAPGVPDCYDALLVVFKKQRVTFIKFCATAPIRAYMKAKEETQKQAVIGRK